MPEPYYADDQVTLYHGDARDLVPDLDPVDAIITDPPYGDTALAWDAWPDGWVTRMSAVARSMWCFGSMRMWMARTHEFTERGWTMSQDLVWEKHNGSGFAADRFKRVHEHVVHWYRGLWSAVYHETPTTMDATARQVRSKGRPAHTGDRRANTYTSEDGGPRLMRSVLPVRSMHGRAIHPTEKPVALLDPLIRYACPPGGTVLDPFAGSGSTAAAARLTGRQAVLIEIDERYCDQIARRLAQGLLWPNAAEPAPPLKTAGTTGTTIHTGGSPT
jgi:site-specific DNA-methyltransferase (adenine-specific)